MSSPAGKLYEEFHKYSPQEIGEFHSSFFIPELIPCVGPALFVLYRSSKKDPITYVKPDKPVNYIHEHKDRVKVYIVGSEEGPERKVPQRICAVDELAYMGKCLGFGYTDWDGEDVEAECTGKIDLYAVPPLGKGLIVVENKRRVLAMIWGGKLRVEPRGIVG
jgi:hypothetical protein